MPQRVRIADGIKTQSAEQLVTMAGAVITGLTNNPAFPAPTVDLKAVQAAVDGLNAAQEVSHLQCLVFGGTAHSFCASLKNVVEGSNTGRLILCLPAGLPLSSP